VGTMVEADRRAPAGGTWPLAGRCLAVGHRGAPRRFTENTLPSIVEAVRLGADAVEVDVRVTRDGVAVLHHDAALPRRWGGGLLAELTLDQLRARAPWIPTLAEALALMEVYGTPLVLDIGSLEVARACLAALDGAAPFVAPPSGRPPFLAPPSAPAPSLSAAAASASARAARAWFCGAAGALAWLRSQDAALMLLLTWDRWRLPPDALLDEIAPTMFNPSHHLLSAGAVSHWHDLGVAVCTWTVDRRQRRERLLAWGIDAIISNDVSGAVRDCRRIAATPAIEAR
jgi:glycerophosphoryl diester phosphodiesterase